MLQQTQVDRVVPYYERLLAAFPTPAACAAARPAAVVRLWSGLGYNRRALNLHRAAVAMRADHDGRVPEEEAELRALPGVGPYTARAVRSFAFGDDVAAVDTNGVRVLARGGRCPADGAGGDGTRGPSRAGRRVVGVQPVDVRPGRHRLHGGTPRLRAVPAAPPVRLAPPASVDSVHRVHRHRHRRRPVAVEPHGAPPEHLRRIGSSGQGPPAPCPAPGRGAPERPGRSLRLARRPAASRTHSGRRRRGRICEMVRRKRSRPPAALAAPRRGEPPEATSSSRS